MYKKLIYFGICLVGLCPFVSVAGASADITLPSAVFTKNMGQLDEPVRYTLRGPRGSIFFTSSEVVFLFIQEQSPPKLSTESDKLDVGTPVEPPLVSKLVFRYRFEGANPSPEIVGLKRITGKTNVIRGAGQGAVKGIPAYREIVYKNLYEGVDVQFNFDKSLGVTLWLHDGAAPEQVRFAYSGIDRLSVDESGDLIVSTPFGDFHERIPALHFVPAETEKGGNVRFTLLPGNIVGLDISEEQKTP